MSTETEGRSVPRSPWAPPGRRHTPRALQRPSAARRAPQAHGCTREGSQRGWPRATPGSAHLTGAPGPNCCCRRAAHANPSTGSGPQVRARVLGSTERPLQAAGQRAAAPPPGSPRPPAARPWLLLWQTQVAEMAACRAPGSSHAWGGPGSPTRSPRLPRYLSLRSALTHGAESPKPNPVPTEPQPQPRPRAPCARLRRPGHATPCSACARPRTALLGPSPAPSIPRATSTPPRSTLAHVPHASAHSGSARLLTDPSGPTEVQTPGWLLENDLAAGSPGTQDGQPLSETRAP